MNTQKQKTILLVEDDLLIAMAEIRSINKVGYEVITANTGEQAVEVAISNENIKLILMDFNLGKGIDGPQAAKQILEKRNMPIVFLTSHFEKEYVEKVKEVTRYGYVIKNSGDFVLKSSIEMAFELFEANMNTKKKISELEESEESLSILLQSVSEGVILTDIKGCITRMNKTAEKFTGWSFAESQNKQLIEIFKIVNEFSRTPVENPIKLVLETGEIIGLANHTVLISRTGDEYQIVNSTAPIRDNQGITKGVILVFSDVTDKYSANTSI